MSLNKFNGNNLFHLIIKNIPEKFSDSQLKEILKKNFESDVLSVKILKLAHKYSLNNNKVCLIALKDINLRQKFYEFFEQFDLIDPKGIKHKLIINDCINQAEMKISSDDDIIENTIEGSKIFLKKFLIFKNLKNFSKKTKLLILKQLKINVYLLV